MCPIGAAQFPGILLVFAGWTSEADCSGAPSSGLIFNTAPTLLLMRMCVSTLMRRIKRAVTASGEGGSRCLAQPLRSKWLLVHRGLLKGPGSVPPPPPTQTGRKWRNRRPLCVGWVRKARRRHLHCTRIP